VQGQTPKSTSSFNQMGCATSVSFNGSDGPVGETAVRTAAEGHPNRKPAIVLADDLDVSNRFAFRPLPHRVKAVFAQNRIAVSRGNRFVRHANQQASLAAAPKRAWSSSIFAACYLAALERKPSTI
jgi:hypothetical protein